MEGSKTLIVHIHTVLEGFAYPCETGYADFVRVYGAAHLKNGFAIAAEHPSSQGLNFHLL